MSRRLLALLAAVAIASLLGGCAPAAASRPAAPAPAVVQEREVAVEVVELI